MLSKEELIVEYAKSYKDYSYFTQKYFKTFDQTKNKFVEFKMFGQQKELMYNLQNNDQIVVYKARQLGASTTIAAFCACYMIFNSDRKVAIIAHKLDGSTNVLKKIKEFINSRPFFLQDIQEVVNNQKNIKLNNGSEAIAFSSSSDSLRSFTPTLILIDECAFIPNALSLYESVVGSSSTGSKMILCSTPNGQDELFYSTVQNSLGGKNNFVVQKMFWWRDERFNKNLIWMKAGDFITPKDESHSLQLYDEGYIPTSDWFETTKKKLNYDERRINQEYMLDFLGSKDLFIKGEILEKAEEETIVKPLRHDDIYKSGAYYEYYEKDKVYGIGADISSGSSSDNSAMVVYNLTDHTVAAEFCDKVPSEKMGEIIYHFGSQYNFPLVIVDVTGGIGDTTISELKRLSYPNIYESIHSRQTKIQSQTKRYGFYITVANRPKLLDVFRSKVYKGEFKIQTKRLLEELKQVSYENGVVVHSRTGHDDLLFAYALVIYVHASEQLVFKHTQLYNSLRLYDSMNDTSAKVANDVLRQNIAEDLNNPYVRWSWLLQ